MQNKPRWITFASITALVAIWTMVTALLIARLDSNDQTALPTLAKMPTQIAAVDTEIETSTAIYATDVPTATAVIDQVVSDRDTEASLKPTATEEPLAHIPDEPVANQMVIQFAPHTPSAERDAYLQSIGGTVQQTIDSLNTVVVLIPAGASAQALPESEWVTTSEPDYYVRAQLDIPTSDPQFENQWALTMIKAPDAWAQLPTDTPTLIVAVIDSGACLNHPDLSGRFLSGWDFVQDDAIPQDEMGHGCGVSGIIAANIDNGIGMAGTAPNVAILPLRVLDADGVGTYSDVAAAMVRAADAGVDLMNLSLGGTQPSSLLENAVNYAVARGVTVIAAAGNNGSSSVLYPARYENAVAVGAVKSNGTPASFSNYGEDVDIWAPGEGVLTTTLYGGYGTVNGTSFAAPYATGVAALEMAFGRSLVLDGGIAAVHTEEVVIEDPTPEPGITRPTPAVPSKPLYEEPTDEWAVILPPGVNPNAVASTLGYIFLGQVGTLENTYLFRIPGSGTSVQAAEVAAMKLASAQEVLYFEQQILREYDLRQDDEQTTFYGPKNPNDDPLTSYQWHLNNTVQWVGGVVGEDANVMPAWSTATGEGVVIAIVDDGLQHAHPDLAPNYNASGSRDINDNDSDPSPSVGDGHGTAAAGVAAAADEITCGVGVAYDAQLSGIRLIAKPITDAQKAAGITYQYNINDIYNNSWGPADNNPAQRYLPLGTLSKAALVSAITNGRGGLGTVYIWAAGNGLTYTDNSNADALANSRYTIAVSATTQNGTQASYSEPGSNILVNAPSNGSGAGIITTDLMGTDGYNNSQGWSDYCTDIFGGTSSAAPLVSGVAALMLDANPNLTWRDVQHILVNTAETNDSGDSSWFTNAASHTVSEKFGHGRVDAAAAVSLAQTWRNVAPEVTYDSGTISVNAAIPENGSPVTSSMMVTEDLLLEHVDVVFNATHPFRGDIVIELVSPSGTVSRLMTADGSDGNANISNWTFNSTHFWDESSAGLWTINVYDNFPIDSGTFNSWRLKLYGTNKPVNDDVADAINIASIPTIISSTSQSATDEGTDPNPGCGTNESATVWYTYTPPSNQNLRMVTDADFDVVLSVWSGTPGSFTQVGCNDNSGIGSNASLNVSLNGGTTYYIMIAGNNGANGLLDLYIGLNQPVSPNIFVTSADDTNDGVCNETHCSLREAINLANTTGGPQTIGFNISPFGTASIKPTSALPTLTDTVIIDGRSQPGYAGTPPIEIDGSLAGNVHGLTINSSNSTIRELVINNFDQAGVYISGGSFNNIIDNYIGVDLGGTISRPNGIGVQVESADNLIHAVTNKQIISGNTGAGVWLNGANALNNILQWNHIGLNVNGTSKLGNSTGVRLTNGANFNTVVHNTISGNTSHGVYLSDTNTSNNNVIGNIIGLSPDGNGVFGNGGDGVRVTNNANANNIGSNYGTTPGSNCTGDCNLISGNTGNGIRLIGVSNTSIVSNFVGTDLTGTIAHPNANGVVIDGSGSTTNLNTIGGINPTYLNLISGNTGNGVTISGAFATNTTLIMNLIGTDTTGGNALGNGDNGVALENGANTNIIGINNLISGNSHNGVEISGTGTSENTLINNLIGTDNNGMSPVPNGQYGVRIHNYAADNKISDNLISGNTLSGVGLVDSVNHPPTGNWIHGNIIGLTIIQAGALPNGGSGVLIQGATDTLVGIDTQDSEANIIAYNTADGITVVNNNDLRNNLSGNLLYANGDQPIDLKNNGRTSNDANDVDSGPNTLQNYPVLKGALYEATKATVYGELDGPAGVDTTYRIDFYTYDNCGFNGAPGELPFLASATVNTTDIAAGDVNFTVVINDASIPDGDYIFMTATDALGNTSELSECPTDQPTGLNVTSVSQIQLDLDWQDNSSDETAFYVERSPDGTSGWAVIATLPGNTTTYTDTDGINGLSCGTTYYYRVQGYNANSGLWSAYTPVASNTTSTCPGNDQFANAYVVSLNDNVVQDIRGASPEGLDPVPTCGTNTSRTVWFSYTAFGNPRIYVNTLGSSFDTVLVILTGTPGNFTQIACDNNGGYGGTSYLELNVTHNTTYYFMIAGNNNAGGTLNLNLAQTQFPTYTPSPAPTIPPTASPPAVRNTPGLYYNGRWQFRDSNTSGGADIVFNFGASTGGWLPIVGDWDDDIQDIDGIGLYKDGRWILRDISSSGVIEYAFVFGDGQPGWQPIAGDWDGDGKDGIGLYKDGVFMLKNSVSGGPPDYKFTYKPNGIIGTALAGDWNDDGIDTVGLYSAGMWYLNNGHSNGTNPTVFAFGPTDNTWLPVVGDWDKDGDTTVGLYKNGFWRLRNTNATSAPDVSFQFGGLGVPVANHRGGASSLMALGNDPVVTPIPIPTQIPVETTDEPALPTATATLMPPLTSTSLPEVTDEPFIPTATYTPSPTSTYTPLPTSTPQPTSAPAETTDEPTTP